MDKFQRFREYIEDFKHNDYHDATCPVCGERGFANYSSDEDCRSNEWLYEHWTIQCAHCGATARIETTYTLTNCTPEWVCDDDLNTVFNY